MLRSNQETCGFPNPSLSTFGESLVQPFLKVDYTMEISIEEFEIKQAPLIAERIHIQVADLKFGESIRFNVYFCKASGSYELTTMKVEQVLIEGEEYKAWQQPDDAYIVNLILAKLGLTKTIGGSAETEGGSAEIEGGSA